MKTIKQIADELGITKAGLRKYLTEDIRNRYAETVSGVIYISETGENLIKTAFYKSKPETKPDTVTGNQAETVSGISDTVSALVSTLQNELSIKNKQIEVLQDALEREREHSRQQAEKNSDLSQQLAELTRNSQILLKQEQDKTALLLPEQSQAVSSEPRNGAKVKQRPFWQFWKK